MQNNRQAFNAHIILPVPIFFSLIVPTAVTSLASPSSNFHLTPHPERYTFIFSRNGSHSRVQPNRPVNWRFQTPQGRNISTACPVRGNGNRDRINRRPRFCLLSCPGFHVVRSRTSSSAEPQTPCSP